MAEMNIKKRIKFIKGEQKKFLSRVEESFSVQEIATWCEKSERTIRDWRREKFLIDEDSLLIICKKAKEEYPKNTNKIDSYWYAKKGATMGWIAVCKKYGSFPKNEEKRMSAWRKWWKEEGKFSETNAIGKRKSISIPQKSIKLAEFVGIMIGDGSITNYQIQISMSSIVDKDYALYVKKLIEELFQVPVSVIFLSSSNVIKLVVSRKSLVEYCQKIGLKKGNKINAGLSVPQWIYEEKKYQVACLRGIMDTDGCIYNEIHRYKNKTYKYKRWNVTSASKELRKDVARILKNLRISFKERNQRSLQIEKRDEIKKYFKEVGSNNPKHITRYSQK